MKQAKLDCGCPITVDPEQRQHLIECVATIRAGRFRNAQRGECRKEDLKQAATEIDAILEAHANKAGGVPGQSPGQSRLRNVSGKNR